MKNQPKVYECPQIKSHDINILKNGSLLGLMLLLLTTLTTIAQNQAYWIHSDFVKPSKQADYEQVSKDFVEACKKHDIKDIDWVAARIDDGTYLSISPIKNMGDFDKNTLAPLAEKMGEDNFRALFDRFNECYDKHTDYVIRLINDLSYMPRGMNISANGNDYRKYHFFYVTPSTSRLVSKNLKAIKDFYSKKGIKEEFRIYHSGFGAPEEFYVAVISAKDAADYIKTSDEAETQYGDEGKKLFDALFTSITRYETKSGQMRPDLGYIAKQ